MNSNQIQNHKFQNDFKSKSKIVLMISNRDFKSNDLKSSPSLRSADFITLRNEQLADPALSKYWDFARNEKGGFFIRDGLLYRYGYVNGEKVIQMCLPETRVSTVLKLAHDMPFG
jgi:hypothetical protein